MSPSFCKKKKINKNILVLLKNRIENMNTFQRHRRRKGKKHLSQYECGFFNIMSLLSDNLDFSMVDVGNTKNNDPCQKYDL